MWLFDIAPLYSLQLEAGSMHEPVLLQVRSMKDNAGDKTEATPSTAVQMSGLNAVPIAGDDFTVAASLDEVQPCFCPQLPSLTNSHCSSEVWAKHMLPPD